MIFRIFTVLAVLALAVSMWIVSPASRQPRRGPAKQAHLPGYYLKNAVLTDYDAAGNPGVRIDAERIDQIGHSNEVALHNVRVAYQPAGGQLWTMLGDEAQIEGGGKIIEVEGNVRLQGDPAGHGPAVVIHTDALSYNTADSIASTRSDVRIDFGLQSLSARGLLANLKDRTIHLESKVNGHFHP